MHTMHSVGRLMLMAAVNGRTSRVEATGAVLLVVLPRMNSIPHEKLVLFDQPKPTFFHSHPSVNSM